MLSEFMKTKICDFGSEALVDQAREGRERINIRLELLLEDALTYYGLSSHP